MKILLFISLAIGLILIQSCDSRTYSNKGTKNVNLEISFSIDDFLALYVEQSSSTVFRAALNCVHKNDKKKSSIDEFVDCFVRQNPGRKIVELLNYEKYTEIDLRFSNADIKAFLKKEYDNVLQSVEETIKNKVALMTDEIPVFKRKSEGKFEVQINGIKNVDLAIQIIQSSADLQFLEVYEADELYTQLMDLNELATKLLNQHTNDTNYLDNRNEKYFQQYLQPALPFLGIAKAQDTAMVNSILRMEEVKSIFPRDAKFYWSSVVEQIDSQQIGFVLYAVRTTKTTNITTRHIEECHVSTDYKGKPCVLIEFNELGGRLFEELTTENIGRKIAICLNGSVTSAPMVNEGIPDGKAEITGNFTQSEAETLANLFPVGSYPVPIFVQKK